jgi:hypothetical protein
MAPSDKSIVCKYGSVIKQYVGIQPFKNVAAVDSSVVHISPIINEGSRNMLTCFPLITECDSLLLIVL